MGRGKCCKKKEKIYGAVRPGTHLGTGADSACRKSSTRFSKMPAFLRGVAARCMHNRVKGRPDSTLAGSRSVFFDAHVPEKNRFQFIFPPSGGKTLPRAFWMMQETISFLCAHELFLADCPCVRPILGFTKGSQLVPKLSIIRHGGSGIIGHVRKRCPGRAVTSPDSDERTTGAALAAVGAPRTNNSRDTLSV